MQLYAIVSICKQYYAGTGGWVRLLVARMRWCLEYFARAWASFQRRNRGSQLFEFSPLCVYKCFRKLPACVDAQSYWLHLLRLCQPCTGARSLMMVICRTLEAKWAASSCIDTEHCRSNSEWLLWLLWHGLREKTKYGLTIETVPYSIMCIFTKKIRTFDLHPPTSDLLLRHHPLLKDIDAFMPSKIFRKA